MTTTSVIISLAITTVLRGLGQLMPKRVKVTLYAPHFCYPILLLIVLVEYWWGMWEWRSQNWHFWDFLFALISPSVLYLVSVLILPDVSSASVDLKLHYFDYRRQFFLLGALAILLNICESRIFPPHKLVSECNTVRLMVICLFIVGALVKNERVHQLLPVIFLALLVSFVVVKTRQMDVPAAPSMVPKKISMHIRNRAPDDIVEQMGPAAAEYPFARQGAFAFSSQQLSHWA
jgi:hypothetical protein